jgi:hypothetical protein
MKLQGFTIGIFAHDEHKMSYFRSLAHSPCKSGLVFFYGLSSMNVVLDGHLNGVLLSIAVSGIPSRNNCREILILLALIL